MKTSTMTVAGLPCHLYHLCHLYRFFPHGLFQSYYCFCHRYYVSYHWEWLLIVLQGSNVSCRVGNANNKIYSRFVWTNVWLWESSLKTSDLREKMKCEFGANPVLTGNHQILWFPGKHNPESLEVETTLGQSQIHKQPPKLPTADCRDLWRFSYSSVVQCYSSGREGRNAN